MAKCQAEGCENEVRREGYPLCRECWGKQRAAKEASDKKSDAESETRERGENFLSANKIAAQLGVNARRVNLILSELGWLLRAQKGWRVSDYAKQAFGARQREHHHTGIPFVMWPPAIMDNAIFREAISNFAGQTSQPAQKDTAQDAAASSNFREKFPATFRATDGHWVRSKAEMLIDNWLYMSGLVHAYERKLPVEEELYCDFYLPGGKVYLEFWGLENDPKYRERKQAKIAVYKKYNFNLIELSDEHVKNLDDHLPRLLLKFNIAVD
jgi:hypothetical protein